MGLMLSASAMDSENMIVPGICCILSTLLFLLPGKRKEPAATGSDHNK